jgi:hypothetical protein
MIPKKNICETVCSLFLSLMIISCQKNKSHASVDKKKQTHYTTTHDIGTNIDQARRIIGEIGELNVKLYASAIRLLQEETFDEEEYEKLFNDYTNSLRVRYSNLAKLKGVKSSDVDKILLDLSKQQEEFNEMYNQYLLVLNRKSDEIGQQAGKAEFNHKKFCLNEAKIYLESMDK